MEENSLFASSNDPPTNYARPAQYEAIISDRDVVVPMRDGVKLVIDIYRPEMPGKFPALLAFGVHSKDIQGLEFSRTTPAQPPWSALWTGHMESGDTQFFVSRGYVHVIGAPRGVGKSDDGGSREWDSYDLIDWIVRQPWCDGQVGMIGIGAFGAEQFDAAKQQSPHLKAIFPYDPRGAYGPAGGFREEYPGGVLHVFRYLIDHFSGVHQTKGSPGELPPKRDAMWREAMRNPDYKMYPHIYNVVAQKGQHMPRFFETLIDPYDNEETIKKSEADFEKVKVPTYTGAGWYGYTYKTHLNGAQSYFRNIKVPKKLIFSGPAHPDRPLRSFRDEMLRWYDNWLKGVDTGIMKEPPVKFWIMGANEWRHAEDWPPPEAHWSKFYLNSWERLSPKPFTASSADEFQPPDAFVQMPPTQTSKIEKLRYLTEPLPQDMLVAGPCVLNLHASIDQEDTNWIVILKDIGPDVSVQTVRDGEREIPNNLFEREITRGWLKASHRALDQNRSISWKPWHPLTRDAHAPVIPGEINAYAIEILSTANLFRKDHRICLEIASLDLPTGVAGATNAEYIPYHICSSKTTLHKIYHDVKRPSHLLLPVIPISE
jgi:putative CocE/NonD family hydrolase